MDAILVRSLPVQHPEQLVVLNWRAVKEAPVIHGISGSMRQENGGSISPNFPFAAFPHLRANQDVLSSLFAYATAWEVNVVAEDHAELSNVQLVSGGFYDGLGVSPAAGRLIGDEDDRRGAAPVAVISYPYWQQRFAGNPAAIGRTILINNTPFMIGSRLYLKRDAGGRVACPRYASKTETWFASRLVPNARSRAIRAFA